ncbi:MAG: glycosyltransferase [Xenococcaceae cyanobacterium]
MSDRFTYQPRFLPEDGWIQITTTGRLVEKKGIEYVIYAMAKLIPNYPRLRYIIIGEGHLRPHFTKLIQELKLTENVELLGWCNETEIVAILKNTHIFVAPSVTAANGDRDAPINVLKEAMAMGLPVVSTYHGGIPELVEDGKSGFLVPERDATALAEKLAYLIENSEIWSQMGASGREFVIEHYNLTRLNDDLVKVYRSLLNFDTITTTKT